MTQPPETISAEQGWRRLMRALSVTVPAHLHQVARSTRGMRNLRRGR